jgi:hypothetical protein
MAIHLSRSDEGVRQILSASFPSYKGKRIEVSVYPRVRFTGTQWDAGSRTQYRIVRLADMRSLAIAEAPFLRQSELHDVDHEIPDGFVVVALHEGRYEYVEIITPSANVVPALETTVDLSEAERTVLAATRELKSSYGGISNYRFHEANQRTGIQLDVWNDAKTSLISRGLLNKAGAITANGRNAVGDFRI